MSERTLPTDESAICVCKTCGMPVRVIFREGEPRVLAPCGNEER